MRHKQIKAKIKQKYESHCGRYLSLAVIIISQKGRLEFLTCNAHKIDNRIQYLHVSMRL